LCDEEIINTNVDEKWLYETYFETYSHRHITYTNYDVYGDYMRHYKSKLNEVFPIHNSEVHIWICRGYFENNFDMYVKQINFDLSPYYMKYFEENVSSKITEYTNNIDKLTNCLTIEDLERLTKSYDKVVYKHNSCIDFTGLLVKVCPKTVKWKYRNIDDRNYIDKKNEFINSMLYREFAIETDEGEHIVINKTNINEYI
jgi:hypothetical protein